MINPDMPAQQLRLHMGEMTAPEVRTARAAIRWANRVAYREGGAEAWRAAANLLEADTQAEVVASMARDTAAELLGQP